MTHIPKDPWGAQYNAQWRKEQGLPPTKQQKPVKDVHHDVTAAKPKPVIHPATPKPSGETPAECRDCAVSKECKSVLKMWYQHAPRPQLVRAWCNLIDLNAGQMPCLSGLRSDTPADAQQNNKFSLREMK